MVPEPLGKLQVGCQNCQCKVMTALKKILHAESCKGDHALEIRIQIALNSREITQMFLVTEQKKVIIQYLCQPLYSVPEHWWASKVGGLQQRRESSIPSHAALLALGVAGLEACES